MLVDAKTRAAMDALPSRGRKGVFRPMHPEKFIGDARRIVYRSSMEFNVMRRLDADPNVIAWASEPIVIPWADARGAARRYVPDFLIKRRGAGAVEECWLVEVKPRAQSPRHSTLRPGKKKRRTILAEAATLDANRRKWESAERFCKSRGWKFVVLTEAELGTKR